MNKRTWAFLAVAATLGGGGLGLAACSSDSGTGLPSNGIDSSTQDQTTGDGGGGGDGNSSGDTSTGGDSGGGDSGGGDCGKPNSLHPVEAGVGVFCPFQAVDAGYCVEGDKCCNPGKGATHCEVLNADCALPPDAGAEFQCDSPAQCPNASDKCCLVGQVLTDTSVPASCGKLKGVGIRGTFCRASCGSGESEVCWNDTQCTAPATCAAFATLGTQIGYCK